MSETAGTIIKLLSALTSPKSSVKYLTVALSLFISWKYFEVYLKDTSIPSEHLSIIILLIGIGLGSLFGHLIAYISEETWKHFQGKRNNKLQIEENRLKDNSDKIAKEKNDKLFLNNFKSSFEHLTRGQKETLRELSVGNKNLDILDSDISALKDNKYIFLILNVSLSTYLCKINPLITEFVTAQWKQEISSRLDDLFYDDTGATEALLSILKVENEDAETPIKRTFVSSLSEYIGCIKSNSDEDDGGYWIWIDNEVKDALEARTGDEYTDELWVPDDRLS